MPHDPSENESTAPGWDQRSANSAGSGLLHDYVVMPFTPPPLLPFLCALPVVIPGVFPVVAVVFMLIPWTESMANLAGKPLWRQNLATVLQFSQRQKFFLILPGLLFSPLVLAIFFVKPALYEAIACVLGGGHPRAGLHAPPEPAPVPAAGPSEPLSPAEKVLSTIFMLAAGGVVVFVVGFVAIAVWLMWMISTNH